MIDINTIINNAIQQEVNKIVTDSIDPYIANMKREYQQQIAAMREEVEQLKQQRADSPATGEVSTDMDGKVLAKNVVQDLLGNNAAIRQAVYEIAHEAAEAAVAAHLEGYDHDEYDSVVTTVEDANLDSLPDFDDFVKHDDLGDAIEEKINGASITFSL